MICEAIETCMNLSDEESLLTNVIQSFIQLVDQKGFYLDRRLKKSLSANLFAAIYQHVKENCEICQLPAELKQRVRRLFEQKLHGNTSINWPDVKPFSIYPFLAKGKDFIAFCLPATGSILSKLPHSRKHVNKGSMVIHYGKPQTRGKQE